MRWTSLISLLLISHFGNSQSTDITTFFMSNEKKAEIYYGKLAFQNAIELYERILEKKPNDIAAKVRIAQCYTALNDPKNAIEWYRQVVRESNIKSIYKYDYAQALSALGNYPEAKKWYLDYSGEVPDDPRGLLKVAFLNDLKFYQRDSNLYFVQRLPINSPNSDFGLIPFSDGLAFLSSRDEDLFIKYNDSGESDMPSVAPLDFYFTSIADSIYSSPEKLDTKLNTKFHEGPMAVFHHSEKLIFTRNNYQDHKKGTSADGKIKLKLYLAERENGQDWGKIRPFAHNSDEYSVAHPSLSEDDLTLFFSSDMPGGYGGSDIYFCRWENGQWGKPVNVGPEVNTAGDEMFPFISYDDKLYFSSDGLGGFGGFDIYRSYRLGSLFGRPENLGSPINSCYDDFSFTLNKDARGGYFSSNRPGGYGSDDIYSFDVRYLSVIGKVLETTNNTPVSEAEVTVLDSLQNKLAELKTNQQGMFHIDLPLDSKFDLKAEKEGYSPKDFSRVNSQGNRFETDSVTVFMWKHQLFAEGRAFSNETHELLTGVEITLENLTDQKIEKISTGPDGLYFFLLQSDKKYSVRANLDDFVSSQFVINTSGLIADTLRNDFVLEEEYLHKEVIFFDYDAFNILPESVFPLKLMLEVLEKHADTYIIVNGHADAQGTQEYNQRLSERRAKSVVEFLKSKGITGDRIVWRGFGEELLINRCSDGVECPQKEHSKNRRTELKIENSKSETPLQPDKK